MTITLPEYPRLAQSSTLPLIPKIVRVEHSCLAASLSELTPCVQAEKRLNNFIKSDYVSQNIFTLTARDRTDDPQNVQILHWEAPDASRPFFPEASMKFDSVDGVKESKRGGVCPPWSNHWLKISLNIPSKWRDAGRPVICERVNDGLTRY